MQTIICGDFNIDILNRSSRSERYEKLISSFNLEFALITPTRHSATGNTCIDHVIIRQSELKKVQTSIPDFNITDHKCISIRFESEDNNNKKTHKARMYTKKNILNFHASLNEMDLSSTINIDSDIDINVNNFLQTIMNIYDKEFPLTKVTNRKINSPWINKEIRNIIAAKCHVLKKIKKHNRSKDKELLKQHSRNLKRAVSASRNNYYQVLFQASNHKDKWGKINEITNKSGNKSKSCSTLDPRAFGQHFSEIFSTCNKPTTASHEKKVFNNTIYLHATDFSEVSRCFSLLKNKKTHQQNDLPMFLWHSISNIIIPTITILINQMISSAQYPYIFKQATITPIHKRGDINKPANYRPITTLHNLSKIFERILLNRITTFCRSYEILPPSQYGFRPDHSTKDAVLSMLLEIEKNAIEKSKTCCILIDLSKAFDMVDHQTLLNVLNSLGFRGHFQKLMKNYLNDRSFRIKYNNTLSENYKITRGVPQGSIISPILYSIYVNDFSIADTKIIQYADDSTIIVKYSNLQQLSQYLDEISKSLSNYILQKRLMINKEKTKIIIFGDNTLKNVKFLETNIQISTSVNVLGIFIHCNRKFNFHVENKVMPNIRKVYPILYQLARISDKNTKKIIFHSFILPHIIYSLPFINICDKSAFIHLERTYNKALRILFCLPYRFPSHNLPQKTNIPSLSEVFYHHTTLLAHRIYNNPLPDIDLHFRRTKRHNFIIDHHTDNYSMHNFMAQAWNALPFDLKTTIKITTLKGLMKKKRNK